MKELDERVRQAVAELRATILERYPAATFVLTRSPDDPRSIHLEAIADVDDPDEVGDLVIDRVVEMQAEEGISIHVIPLQTPELHSSRRPPGEHPESVAPACLTVSPPISSRRNEVNPLQQAALPVAHSQ
jgi:hypothetical protein